MKKYGSCWYISLEFIESNLNLKINIKKSDRIERKYHIEIAENVFILVMFEYSIWICVLFMDCLE